MKRRFLEVRSRSVEICTPLETEDMLIQSCPDVSPPKWHLAHTSWFFEEFILTKENPSYRVFNEDYRFLFNSYYKTVGQHWHRVDRGKLSRPTVKEVLKYREYVDECMLEIIGNTEERDIISLIEIGLHHEQQHQELLLMDIKHILSLNPIAVTYEEHSNERSFNINQNKESDWLKISGGNYEFGASESDFHYDNESPRHKRRLDDAQVSRSLVSNAEYMEFIQDSGYERAELWLSLGWDWINENKITSPLYWRERNGDYFEYTLYGEKELIAHWPVQHISFFEADAYARWKGMRLPSEFELEILSREKEDNVGGCELHGLDLTKINNNLWCWSKDQYQAYPGYKPYKGCLGEYNQKFMCNQFVLRGGSFATPEGHFRSSYRNFFEPWQRWMFSGIRLARDII